MIEFQWKLCNCSVKANISKRYTDLPLNHDATGSLLGYLAQCRYALLMALDELRKNPGHEISIERFDDIAFEQSGTPKELIQTKHHGSACDVSDYSVDVWKTMRIWIARIDQDPLAASQTKFVLLTTSTASDDSALLLLRDVGSDRDVVGAIEKLTVAAEKSENKSSQAGREAFLALEPSLRQLFVSNIFVYDRAPNITNVREEIEAELMLGVPSGQISEYADRVEGWWFSRVVASLSKVEAPTIRLSSLLAKLTEIRDDFKADALPLSPDVENIELVAVSEDDDRTFVRQLRLVDIADGPASRAVQDYYKAFVQRSKWARQDLLLDEEADRYDGSLKDALEREFDAAFEESSPSNDDEKRKLGRRLFHWSRRHSQPLRNRFEQWLSSGSFQMLADRQEIGWHPDYATLLSDEESDP